MTRISHAAEANTSWIKLNRLKDNYTWNIQVAAESNSVEDLRSAKEKAVVIANELEAGLNRPVEEDEVAF